MFKAWFFFFLPELSPSSDTDELTVSSSSVLLPSCSGKSTSISSWLFSFFSREWTGIVRSGWAGADGLDGLFVDFSPKNEANTPQTANRLASSHLDSW